MVSRHGKQTKRVTEGHKLLRDKYTEWNQSITVNKESVNKEYKHKQINTELRNTMEEFGACKHGIWLNDICFF